MEILHGTNWWSFTVSGGFIYTVSASWTLTLLEARNGAEPEQLQEICDVSFNFQSFPASTLKGFRSYQWRYALRWVDSSEEERGRVRQRKREETDAFPITDRWGIGERIVSKSGTGRKLRFPRNNRK